MSDLPTSYDSWRTMTPDEYYALWGADGDEGRPDWDDDGRWRDEQPDEPDDFDYCDEPDLICEEADADQAELIDF